MGFFAAPLLIKEMKEFEGVDMSRRRLSLVELESTFTFKVSLLG